MEKLIFFQKVLNSMKLTTKKWKMASILSAFSLLLGGSIVAATPANAVGADYTIDCSLLAPGTYDANDMPYVGDGTAVVTLTVEIKNCGLHYVRNAYPDNILQDFLYTTDTVVYTLNVPTCSLGDAWGSLYDWGNRANDKTKIISFMNSGDICNAPADPTLNASSTGNGTAVATDENSDGIWDLSADADPGFTFSYWACDVATPADVNSASTTVQISEDTACFANFTEAVSTIDGSIEGVLIKQSINELPAPDVAMASDGRSLIVWQDASPDNVSGVCDENGNECSILGSIVDADGVTYGSPFLISGDVVSDFYYSAPSVLWNEDLNEWLVLFTSQSADQDGIYAQRVAADGSLVGSIEVLPMNSVTTIADRSTVESLTLNSPVQVTANWSSIDQAYLVTWLARGNASPVGGASANNRNDYGYFMDADLTSVDGVDAAFVLSTGAVSTWSGLVKQAYSPILDEWAFLWAVNSQSDKMQMRTITLEGTTIEATESVVVADASADGFDYNDSMMVGDIVWVSSMGNWVLSWNAQPEDGDTWNAYARTISADGTLGDPVRVTDFSVTGHGTPADWMNSHQLYYDAKTDVIYAAGSVRSYSAASDSTELVATIWSFDAVTLAPLSSYELIAPMDVEGETFMYSSSRARITGNNGAIGVVYQNWPLGEWDDPAEVRYHLLASVDPTPTPAPLPETGASDNSGLVAGSVFAMALGVIAVYATRRRALRAE